MYDHVIGSGANLFIIILALLFGFVNALAYVDSVRVKRDQETKKRGD